MNEANFCVHLCLFTLPPHTIASSHNRILSIQPTDGVFDVTREWYAHDPALFTQQELDLQARINALPLLVDNAMSRSRIDEAFEHVTELGRAANVYFASQEPWKLMSKAVPKGKLHIFPHSFTIAKTGDNYSNIIA